MKPKKVIFILLTALLLFSALTILVVTETTPIHNFNTALYSPVPGVVHPTLTSIATLIGSLTHWYTYTPIVLILLIIPSTRWNAALPIGVTLLVSAIMGPILLKNIFAIERPNINQLIDVGGFGYPSGHSMNAVVFFGMCTIMMFRFSQSKPLKSAFTVFAVIAILLVGISRIYLGVHTVTDVIGGYLAGIVVICASVLIEPRIREKWFKAEK